MINDYYGRPIYTERDLVDIYMKNPSQSLQNTLTATKIDIDPELEIENVPELIEHTLAQVSVADFDEEMRSKWHMPAKYRELDIAKWLLEQCKHEEEIQRVGKELLLYQKRGQFLLLQYMKYLVDLMREHDIVWGVGRGSSVSSFVLFLIGIHRINSIYYGLDIEEFLK
jgi:DNA polymerase III alpha subunit